MDIESFVKTLSVSEKALLTHGKGMWRTQSVNGLPSVTMSDGPHGLRKQSDTNNGINDSAPSTCFPSASAVASSWNRENARAVAKAIAEEATALDVSLVLGPGLNIKRSPLCGRNFEYFSEDPLLAGELASEFVLSMQANGVGCCAKHFAVNSQETSRMTVDAIVDERALREIYLSAFERVVKKAHPYAVMASYNKINGASATENKTLLTDILRGEWGFDGAVISDWGACYDMAKAYSAGMDLEMPDGGKYHESKTVCAINSGELKMADIDRACANVAKLAVKCSAPKEKKAVNLTQHRKLCKNVALDSAVLLKNNGILPLSKNTKILVVGELAEKVRFQGAGSSHVNAECRSFLDVLKSKGVDFVYLKGYSVFGDSINEDWETEVAKHALNCNTVLFFGGLTDENESEGFDRTKLDIPECQQSMLNVISQHNPNVVFVAVGGAPFACPWINQVKALLNMYLGGEAVSEAMYELLFGEVSPSGRLAETFPLRLEDTPCYNYFANDDYLDEHRESIFVGYRYYNTFDVPVQFPFGFGLSYSVFTYSNFSVAPREDGFEVSVVVKNIGSMDASEVVQVYLDNCECGYMRAKRQLCAFDKVFVPSGKEKTVTLHVDKSSFTIFAEGKFAVVNGKYKISVCKDVETPLYTQTVEVEGTILKGQDRKKYPAYYNRRSVLQKDPFSPRASWQIDEEQFYRLVGTPKPQYATPKRGQFDMLTTLGEMGNSVRSVRKMIKYIGKHAVKHSPTKRADDPVAKMVYRSALGTPLISLMSIGGVKTKYVMFLLYNGNKKYRKALKALRGKYDIE